MRAPLRNILSKHAIILKSRVRDAVSSRGISCIMQLTSASCPPRGCVNRSSKLMRRFLLTCKFLRPLNAIYSTKLGPTKLCLQDAAGFGRTGKHSRQQISTNSAQERKNCIQRANNVESFSRRVTKFQDLWHGRRRCS